VATTATVGLAAITAGLANATGCVTEQEHFDGVRLPDFADFVVGGHDISDVCMSKRAEALVESGMLPPYLLESVRPQLVEADQRVRPGYNPAQKSESQAGVARRLAKDILDFKHSNRLERVIVLDVASTEAPVQPIAEFTDAHLLLTALEDPARSVLPPSSVSAYAAALAGSPYVCFTPSTAFNVPALRELAARHHIPTAGQDGKTGQTWLRSVLAPAFAARGLRVLSWAGTNLLGGGDGATLADPEAVAGKLQSKNRGLQELTGGAATPLHIDNVQDLGETKVAWDHINVEGFLGSRLTLQTTWSAYDSMLAAPMVLDLSRLMALAHASGEEGHVGALGFFFKDPWGSDEHSFANQTHNLVEWAKNASARTGSLDLK
jgi:myo-inositol-1-phosphate synthase